MGDQQRGVGILGGTFDPLHLAHLIIAEEARAHLGLCEVVFVPAGDPYHRGRQPVADAMSRLAMVRLGVASNPAFRVATVDLEREGPSYSVDTVQDLQRQVGEDHPLFFILGWDSLRELHSWHRPDLLAELCQIVAVRRPGPAEMDWNALERLVPEAPERIIQLDTPLIGISATEVRRRVAEGISIRYWVPDPVAAYIAEHHLYRTPVARS